MNIKIKLGEKSLSVVTGILFLLLALSSWIYQDWVYSMGSTSYIPTILVLGYIIMAILLFVKVHGVLLCVPILIIASAELSYIQNYLYDVSRGYMLVVNTVSMVLLLSLLSTLSFFVLILYKSKKKAMMVIPIALLAIPVLANMFFVNTYFAIYPTMVSTIPSMLREMAFLVNSLHTFDIMIHLLAYTFLSMWLVYPRKLPNAKVGTSTPVNIKDIDIVSLCEMLLKAIKPSLKSPATAILCSPEELSITSRNGKYSIDGYVSSHNSYGAMLKTDFTVQATESNGAWLIEKVITGVKVARARSQQFAVNYVKLSIFVAIMGLLGYVILTAIMN